MKLADLKSPRRPSSAPNPWDTLVTFKARLCVSKGSNPQPCSGTEACLHCGSRVTRGLSTCKGCWGGPQLFRYLLSSLSYLITWGSIIYCFIFIYLVRGCVCMRVCVCACVHEWRSEDSGGSWHSPLCGFLRLDSGPQASQQALTLKLPNYLSSSSFPSDHECFLPRTRVTKPLKRTI